MRDGSPGCPVSAAPPPPTDPLRWRRNDFLVRLQLVFGYDQFGHFLLFSSGPHEIFDILTPGGQIPNRFDAPGLSFRQIGNPLGAQRVGHAAVYAKDSWRAAPGLTVDLGFR